MTAETVAEIRNALQIIKGKAQLIADQAFDGDAILGSAVIRVQVDRIVKLLERESV